VVAATLLLALAPAGEVAGASDRSGLDARRLVAAARRAGTIHFRGTSRTTFRGGTRSTGRFSGVVDVRARRAEQTARETMRNTKPRHVETVRFRQRFLDGYQYMSPADVVTDPPGLAIVRPNTKGKEWARVPYAIDDSRGVLATTLGDPIVDVSGPDTEVDRVGSERVQHVPVTHWRVTYRADPPAQVRRSRRTSSRDRVVDVWVDQRNRIRRSVTTTTDDDTHSTVRVDYSRFGDAAHIEAPPSETVVVDDQFLLTRDWHQVQRGRAGGDSWRLFRAETESGYCYSHETDPPVRPFGLAPQRGRTTETCSMVATGALAPPDVPLQGDAFALANGMAVFYGTVSDRAERVIVRTSEGRVVRPVPNGGTFALALGHDETVRRILIEGHGKQVRCPSAPRGSFDCHGSLSDEQTPRAFPTVPPIDPPPPSVPTTAPPGSVPGP
jgi:hypothetical protein